MGNLYRNKTKTCNSTSCTLNNSLILGKYFIEWKLKHSINQAVNPMQPNSNAYKYMFNRSNTSVLEQPPQSFLILRKSEQCQSQIVGHFCIAVLYNCSKGGILGRLSRVTRPFLTLNRLWKLLAGRWPNSICLGKKRFVVIFRVDCWQLIVVVLILQQ